MRVAIIGGTGFVGGYLVDALLADDNDVVALVRPGSEGKLRGDGMVRAITGDLSSHESLAELVGGCQAVIYNVGLRGGLPRGGITVELSLLHI